MREELKLIPLRIPAGWTIELNKLTEVNPNEFKTSDYEYVWEFDEDIMFLTYRELEYSIDLGWYPSFDPYQHKLPCCVK
jgi:hypothetical protein